MLGTFEQEEKSSPSSSLKEVKKCNSIIKTWNDNRVNKYWGCSVGGGRISLPERKVLLHMGYIFRVEFTVKRAKRSGDRLEKHIWQYRLTGVLVSGEDGEFWWLGWKVHGCQWWEVMWEKWFWIFEKSDKSGEKCGLGGSRMMRQRCLQVWRATWSWMDSGWILQAATGLPRDIRTVDVMSVPLNIHSLKLDPWGDGVRRWGLWRRWSHAGGASWWDYGISVLVVSSLNAPTTPSSIRGHSRKVLPMNQEGGSHRTPNLLVPWSWASSL